MRRPAPIPLILTACVVVAAGVGLLSGPGMENPPIAERAAAADEVDLRPAPAPRRRIHPVLQGAMTELVRSPETALDGEVGLLVLDEQGYPMLEEASDLALVPASTMKVVTAAAALRTLGPEHRYVTTVRAEGHPERSGQLRGDLVLVGGGDPALATPGYAADVYPARPRSPLEDLAEALVEAGIEHVEGDLVADSSVLADEPIAPGWSEHYLADLDATRSAGLTVDAGRVIEWTDDGRVLATAAEDPALEAGRRLAELLEERGVTIGGAVRTGRAAAATTTLAELSSPPLEELLRHAVQRSDNHMADGVFRSLGTAEGGSWRSAAAAVRDALADLELDWHGVVLADGSGLSRRDRLTASFLVRLDAAMGSGDLARTWREIMAVAGESGTLARRLRGTAAHGVLRGKTGALTDVRAFVGHLELGVGRRYHLAVIGNELAGDSPWRFHEVVDRIALLLAEDLRCDRDGDEPIVQAAGTSGAATDAGSARTCG